MSHDASKVQMGTTASNIREVDNRIGTILAGTVVRLKSDGTLSVAKADGAILGVSVGKDLSNIGRTAILRKGLKVPLRLTDDFTPQLGAPVYISDTTGLAIASGAGATLTAGTYASGLLSGRPEDGSADVRVALVDMIGGL